MTNASNARDTVDAAYTSCEVAEGAEEGPLPADTSGEFTALAKIVRETERGFAVDGATTHVTFALMAGRGVVNCEVPVAKLGELLNRVGQKSAAVGCVDAQFAMQERTSKAANGLAAIYGITIEFDRPSLDPLTEVLDAGLPMPQCWYLTTRGFRLVWAASEPMPVESFEEQARRAGLSIEGADASSWTLNQFQRLPHCLKSSAGGVRPVNFDALQSNRVPMPVGSRSFPFPGRLLRALGSDACSEGERTQIRDHLESIGLEIPERGERSLNSCCPTTEVHGSACCYANVSADGAISVHCLGGHDGEGAKHWNEQALLGLVVGFDHNEVAGFDPLRDLQVTHAGVGYINDKLKSWGKPEREAALLVWIRERARRESHGKGSLEAMMAVYRTRLQGADGMGSVSVYFDVLRGHVAFDDARGRSFAVAVDRGINLKNNTHEALSTAVYTLVARVGKGETHAEPGFNPRAPSILNKLSIGYGEALRAAGVAEVTRHELPIAHVEETWSIAPQTKHVTATLLPERKAAPELDAIAFFVSLWRDGKLPLATENDARLLVCALAAPLLRNITGQLGIYWFVGPPGSGKDYLAEMLRVVWESVTTNNAPVSFDISLAGDLELKRSFDAAGGSVYGRAKEAGKRSGMADMLIRMAGTDKLSARGLYKAERLIPNTFTVVADSAEDMPDRREISRRTVMINLRHVDESVSKGSTLAKVRKAGPSLLANLKRILEERPQDYYWQQTDTGSRPLVPIALAKIFGAVLPKVEGENLTELFEAMLFFAEQGAGKEGGQAELRKAIKRGDKESKYSRQLPSHRFGLFVDTLRMMPGYRELIERFGASGKAMVNRILRESDYASVRSNDRPYLRVELDGMAYGFRIEANRRFILAPEVAFLEMTCSECIEAPPERPLSGVAGEDRATFAFSSRELLS